MVANVSRFMMVNNTVIVAVKSEILSTNRISIIEKLIICLLLSIQGTQNYTGHYCEKRGHNIYNKDTSLISIQSIKQWIPQPKNLSEIGYNSALKLQITYIPYIIYILVFTLIK